MAAIILGVLCVGEQRYGTCAYDKEQIDADVKAIAGAVPPSAQTFFVSAPSAAWHERVDIDAMWATFETGRPTVNGYSGNIPPGYDLRTVMSNDVELADGGRRLKLWCEQQGLDLDKVAWIHDRQVMPIPR